MAIAGITAQSTIDPQWLNLIELTIKSEKTQRYDKYTQAKDTVDVKKSIYTDLKNNLNKVVTAGASFSGTDIKAAIASFTESFNASQTYIAQKTGVTKISEKKYERGALASDYGVKAIRREMVDAVGGEFSTGTTVKTLADLGMEVDDNLHLVVTDATKLDSAITADAEGVRSFLNTKLANVKNVAITYTGTQGIFTYDIADMTEESISLADKITNETERLDNRRNALTAYYETLNSQMEALLQTQSLFSSLYGNGVSLNRYY